MELKEKPNKIKQLLYINGDTYKDLAEIIGVKSITTVTLKVSGKRQWNRGEMIKIKNHYSLSDEEFLSIFFKE